MKRGTTRWRGRTWRWCPVTWRTWRWVPVPGTWTWRRGNVLGIVVSVWLCLVTLLQLSLHPNKLQQVRHDSVSTHGREMGTQAVINRLGVPDRLSASVRGRLPRTSRECLSCGQDRHSLDVRGRHSLDAADSHSLDLEDRPSLDAHRSLSLDALAVQNSLSLDVQNTHSLDSQDSPSLGVVNKHSDKITELSQNYRSKATSRPDTAPDLVLLERESSHDTELFLLDFERSRRRIQEIGSKLSDNMDEVGYGVSNNQHGVQISFHRTEGPKAQSFSPVLHSQIKPATLNSYSHNHHYTSSEHQSQIPRPDYSPQSQTVSDPRRMISPSLKSQGRTSSRANSFTHPEDRSDVNGGSHNKFSGVIVGPSSVVYPGAESHDPAGGVHSGGPSRSMLTSSGQSRSRSKSLDQSNSRSPLQRSAVVVTSTQTDVTSRKSGVTSRKNGVTSQRSGVTSRTIEDSAVVMGTRLKRDGFLEHAYNVTASDLLPLDRVVPDTRPPGCPRELPEVTSLGGVSVVICAHNEAVSVLRRTVASVLLKSPPGMLQEVLVIDDNSTTGDPQRALADMEVGVNQGKLRVIKTQRRLGLVRGRLLGAREAKGQVLVFLDSHCECGPGWLPPLLQALEVDSNKVVSPYIDVIRSESFVYTKSPDNLQGDFSWRLEFGWRPLPESVAQRREGSHQPIDTPVISGGLFAVDRHFFFHMGAYDEQMDIWGGENMEMSFRIWMCGGKMEIIPCSRVGHVFRNSVPYTFPGDRRHTVLRNLARAATVWMDDHSLYFFAAVNMSRNADVTGDVSSRDALRRRLQCRSFQWYLDHVAWHLQVPSLKATHYGQFKNRGSLLCLAAAAGPAAALGDLHLEACHGGDNQTLQLLNTGELQLRERCVYPGENKRLVLSVCPQRHQRQGPPDQGYQGQDIQGQGRLGRGQQGKEHESQGQGHKLPEWTMQSGHIQLVGTDLCLTSVDNEFVHLRPCQLMDIFQTWEPTYTFTWTERSP